MQQGDPVFPGPHPTPHTRDQVSLPLLLALSSETWFSIFLSAELPCIPVDAPGISWSSRCLRKTISFYALYSAEVGSIWLAQAPPCHRVLSYPPNRSLIGIFSPLTIILGTERCHAEGILHEGYLDLVKDWQSSFHWRIIATHQVSPTLHSFGRYTKTNQAHVSRQEKLMVLRFGAEENGSTSGLYFISPRHNSPIFFTTAHERENIKA